MANPDTTAGPELAYRRTPDGRTLVELSDGGRWVSRCAIVPLVKRIGAATVRFDGIGDVRTADDCRHRGYSRRVLEAAVARMRAGDAALSMLYGIRDFYPKFGFATVGAEYTLHLLDLDRPVAPPAGWTVRPFAPADLPRVRELYERDTARAVGAVVRGPDAPAWGRLLATADAGSTDECGVLEDQHGRLAAYVWRGADFWSVAFQARRRPEWLFLGEVIAAGPAAADAALAVCRAWGAEESARREGQVERVVLGLPPEGPVAAAARLQDAELVTRAQSCGGTMVRLLDAARLLRALAPELNERLRAAGLAATATLRIETDEGGTTLHVAPDGVRVVDGETPGAADGEHLRVTLPQTALARLALGGFPPGDLLDRLPAPPDARAREVLEALFPRRHPYTHLLDRY